LTVEAGGDTRDCGLLGGQIVVRFARSAGAMLVACRLAGLPALEAHHAEIDVHTLRWASAARPEALARNAGPPGTG
jgi:hypothetical protein